MKFKIQVKVDLGYLNFFFLLFNLKSSLSKELDPNS